jgi:type IV secretory pathway VirB6-like protein
MMMRRVVVVMVTVTVMVTVVVVVVKRRVKGRGGRVCWLPSVPAESTNGPLPQRVLTTPAVRTTGIILMTCQLTALLSL